MVAESMAFKLIQPMAMSLEFESRSQTYLLGSATDCFMAAGHQSTDDDHGNGADELTTLTGL